MPRKPKDPQLDLDELLAATGPQEGTVVAADPVEPPTSAKDALVAVPEIEAEPVDDSPIDLILPEDGISPGLKVEIEETFHLDERGEMVPGEKPLGPLQAQRERVFADQRDPAAEGKAIPGLSEPPPAPKPYIPPALANAKPIRRYTTRVDVLEAYQFDGRLALAPHWVDKNWLGYADGVIILVPQAEGMQPAHCRVGDWIVFQERMDEDGNPMMRELVVYPDEAFRLLFREIAA